MPCRRTHAPPRARWCAALPNPNCARARALAAQRLPPLWAGDFAASVCVALASALLANVAIVGFNQIFDVAIDRINKPYLPLASGEMRPARAWAIVGAAAAAAVLIAAGEGAHRCRMRTFWGAWRPSDALPAVSPCAPSALLRCFARDAIPS